MKKKVLVVIGTRPEAIKMSPLIRQLCDYQKKIKVWTCVTGQHREMIDQVLTLFNIFPDIDLDLMRVNQTPSQVASRVLSTMDPILEDLHPDLVLVQEDTTTVMSTSIAAHYHRIEVGHVEAGLRTYDRFQPFPEEMNRVVTDHISDLHFSPTARACKSLLLEGISRNKIFITGNTVIDALNWVVKQPAGSSLHNLLESLGRGENRLSLSKRIILVTAHRRESFGKPLQNICNALQSLADRNDVHFIYPVHHNPNIFEPVHKYLGKHSNITLIPPVDYQTKVQLMKHNRLILTDSAGIQEEAPSLGIPVLVLRDTSERPEAVDAGAARLVGTDSNRIIPEVERLLDDQAAYNSMARVINPYGDGQAAERIIDILITGSCEEFSPTNQNHVH